MVIAPVQLTDLIVTVAQEHADALGRLTAAVELSGQLDELGDHLIGHFVDEARRSGASWTEIGESIGVTKQAAQKRFVPKESPDLKPSFDRYTDRARRVVVLARHHARFSERIGTEHLLLGLMDESGGVGAKAIAKLEGAEGTTRLATLNALDRTSRERPPNQPFTAHCKKALELTVREALRLGHTFVGTEHLLLGLLSVEECTAAEVMATTGITKAAAESYVVAEFTKAITAPRQAPPGG
ncbi:Clp protease N-terminal domain-containing protein [Saccharothrix obliqua]|uniref:Clp protease N-terminal domain-containing protein n=1 Tax=Saccharothrix obliqua TaxID=2861747 RepID=UPI001C5F246B|nr:Clp protease N-terminal domain-containing protein [Saccharothrix obliqua]MBW4720055.1 Clp protease [Saccharothrix obliqua]